MCRAPLEGRRFQVNAGFRVLSCLVTLLFTFSPAEKLQSTIPLLPMIVGHCTHFSTASLALFDARMHVSLIASHRRYFAARGEEGRAQDRPHFVYGDYQRRRKLPPEALARSVDEAWANSLDPLEGGIDDG